MVSVVRGRCVPTPGALHVLLELRLNKDYEGSLGDYAWPGECVILRVAAVQRIVPGVWPRVVSDAE